MNKFKNILLTTMMLIVTKISFADSPTSIVWWEFHTDLREWDITFGDIPAIMTNAINFLMWIAATISVIFIIIWAYKILFGSISQDKTKWRDTILMAIWGFIIASLAWFIIKLILDNFS